MLVNGWMDMGSYHVSVPVEVPALLGKWAGWEEIPVVQYSAVLSGKDDSKYYDLQQLQNTNVILFRSPLVCLATCNLCCRTSR